jgi:hypothetical protein
MKKLFSDEQLEEARSFASPVRIFTSCNRYVNYKVKKYVIFYYPDAQHPTRASKEPELKNRFHPQN